MTTHSAKLLDGTLLAKDRRRAVKERLALIRKKLTLATLQVGESNDIALYRDYLKNLSDQLGFHVHHRSLAADANENKVLGEIASLNAAPAFTGIMVFSPLPRSLDSSHILDAINPHKDVEGRTFLKSHHGVFSPTANAAMLLIESAGRRLNGLKAVVIGHSDLVGKPIAVLLMDKMATVTVCHAETRDLAAHVAEADIVVAAVGKPGIVKGAWIKSGAIVIDVGENVVDGKITGDVEFDAAHERADFITPVPGGVGPLTNVVLVENLIRLHELEQRRGNR